MITFTIGKIPGIVKEFTSDAEGLTVLSAIQMAVADGVCDYDSSMKVYVGGVEAPVTQIVQNNDVILIDLPKVKGAVGVITVVTKNGRKIVIGIKGDESIGHVLGVACIPFSSDTDKLIVDGREVWDYESVGGFRGTIFIKDKHASNETSSAHPVRTPVVDAPTFNIYTIISEILQRLSDIEDDIANLS